MIALRKSSERGFADHGWLKSYHSFSFADYYDPAHMGVGNLRVINEDRIAAGTGFGTHGHRDMEIVSYVLDGELAHKDDMGADRGAQGHSGVILPGDVQRMSAGSGVRHSEFNHAAGTTHFLQIWLLPAKTGIAPSYEQKHFDDAGKRGALRLVASPDGREGSVQINADAAIHAGLFDGDERADVALPAGRLAYLHVARGSVTANGRALGAGDAITLAGEPRLVLEGGRAAEVLLFDLNPMERT